MHVARAMVNSASGTDAAFFLSVTVHMHIKQLALPTNL